MYWNDQHNLISDASRSDKFVQLTS